MDSTHQRARGWAGRRRWMPSVEDLEGRQLLSTTLPDIAMDSATTADSQSVTIQYDLSGPAIQGPVTFSVYRSADTQFDSSDELVGSFQASPAGSTATTLDQAGQPAMAPGHHELTFRLPGGLPPNPEHPYVLVVADPGNTVPEASEANNTASFRTYVVGIVTHGGMQPKSWKQGPMWVGRMATGLRSQGYDLVIPFNWVYDSSHPGAVLKQGSRLAATVAEAASQFPADAPVDVHFIGHSEGTVVNSLAMLRLNKDGWPASMQKGFLKVTMLDPHPANNGGQGPQYSVSNGLMGQIARAAINEYQSRAQDPPVVVPDNVDAAEVFYQHTPVSESGHANHGWYNLWGQVPVHGSADYYDLTGPGMSHSGNFNVHDWYQVNIVPTLGEGASFLQTARLTGSQVTLAQPSARPSARAQSLVSREATYAGTATPGATVQVLAAQAGTKTLAGVGRTEAGPDGHWQLTTRPLAAGQYRVVAVSDPKISNGLNRHPLHMRPTIWMEPLSVSIRGPKR